MHGKFCVVSDRASLPEVGGDFVDYFDPADGAGYLAAREARLRADCRPPSWADCARRLIDTIDDRPSLVSVRQAPERPG